MEDYSKLEEKLASRSNYTLLVRRNTRIRLLKFILGVIFFLIFLLLICLYLLKGSEPGLIYIGKYSYSIMETGSMVPKYKIGKFMLTEIRPIYYRSDDITYMIGPNKYRTHRIIGMDADRKHYLTQGIKKGMAPDEDPVLAENIIGKVVFSSDIIGWILQKTKVFSQLTYVIAMVILVIVSLFAMLTLKTNEEELSPEGRHDANNKNLINRMKSHEKGKIIEDRITPL